LDKCESLNDSSLVEAQEDYILLNCDQTKINVE